MTEIDNITFREYLELEDKYKYNYVATYSPVLNTPNDLFKIGDFQKLTFGQVKDAQHVFQHGVNWKELFNFVSEITGKSEKQLSKVKFFDWCKVRRYVEVELQKISNIESRLYYETSAMDKAAGIDKLAKFGVGLQIDTLAGGNVLNYDKVKAMDYSICFFKLLMDKEREEYQVEKNKLINKTKN